MNKCSLWRDKVTITYDARNDMYALVDIGSNEYIEERNYIWSALAWTQSISHDSAFLLSLIYTVKYEKLFLVSVIQTSRALFSTRLNDIIERKMMIT